MTGERTTLAAARRALRERVETTGRTETLALGDADGRVLASEVVARRDVPHYERAAMDGYAIRADDTTGAANGRPARLDLTDGSVGPGEAARVHTGSELPAGADTVVRLERAERGGGGIDVSRVVPAGKDVAPAGEDVHEGQHLHDPGHRLRPSDLGLLKSTGIRAVETYERPTVALLPTGEEVVEADPDAGEVVETNGLTIARHVDRWGGIPRREDVIPDEHDALAGAIRGAADADVIATIGGSSVGARDLVPGVIEAVGDLRVHGVAIKPGHPVGIGVVEGTPVVSVPGYPVSAIINAVQFLRPALHWRVGTTPAPFPATRATLAEGIDSDRGVRRYSRVRLERAVDDPAEPPTAVPTAHSGAGVLSSVALADGWVEVPEGEVDLESGTAVAVRDWGWHP